MRKKRNQKRESMLVKSFFMKLIACKSKATVTSAKRSNERLLFARKERKKQLNVKEFGPKNAKNKEMKKIKRKMHEIPLLVFCLPVFFASEPSHMNHL